MTRSELVSLLPTDKHDLASVASLARLGYPAVEPVLPQLLEWMQDINWPVAQALQPFLTAIGAPLAPAVRAVLAGNDDIWKYWLLEAVVRRSGSLALALKPELTAIAASDEARSDPDWRELRATAGEIIEKFDLADAPPLAR